MTYSRGDQPELVQQRLALLGKVMLALMTLLCVTQGALNPGDLQRASYWFLVAGSGFWLVLVLDCRGAKRSPTRLRVVEAMCMLGWVASMAFAVRLLMVAKFADTYTTGDIEILADQGVNYEKAGATALAFMIGLALTIRAAAVPTGPRYTTGLTVAAFILFPVPWMFGAPLFDMPIYHLPGQESGGPVEAVIATLVLFGIMTTFACYIVSRVVFGLRVEVRDAQALGQYTLLAKIGEGGMGVVYRAKHAMMQRPTAIKLLSGDAAGELQLERFEREVQLTTRLTHPNTITIFDYGRTPEGIFYYVMELLDGASLEAVVKEDGPQPAERVVNVLLQVAGALEEAHDIGLIHRDIKPANIILCNQGGRPDVAKVLDFGLVKEIDSTGSTALTKAESITGTPQYLAPEMITDPENIDGRSDIYALGAVGYFMLTGKQVFSGKTVLEVCSDHLHTEPIPPSKRTDNPVPSALELLILDCLAKDPGDRPDSAATLAERLRACEVEECRTSAHALGGRPMVPSSNSKLRKIRVGRPWRWTWLEFENEHWHRRFDPNFRRPVRISMRSLSDSFSRWRTIQARVGNP
ncbi:MAG: serine/threonine protein kinase [Kofleriaceae bacterium]|nr:serine/threonine protein kinase [Kofleriaceae bacterium]